jgi:hypothetical protein
MAEVPAANDRPPYVLLAESDDVVVLTRHVEPGDDLVGLADQTWRITKHLEVGNKLAARPIVAGQKVVKLGVAIGTATQAIAPGEHVHTHNLRSDHIPIDREERPDDRTN